MLPVETPTAPRKRRRLRYLWIPAAVLLAVFLLNLFLQNVWAHRQERFFPDYDPVDLSPLWEQESLSSSDYDLILTQTGLARPAVDALLSLGQEGIAQIEETQDRFFTPQEEECMTLIGGRFTCEDRLVDGEGSRAFSVPLAPLEKGDIIVTFSTHTFGWRHGHAGLVVQDGEEPITLEAVMMFSDSSQSYAWHWETYSNFMVLRVRDADEQTRQAVAEFALEHLDQIPYRLTSGIFGPKAPEAESDLGAQCAYLPWYAWQAFGYDLDSDGGKIVTVLDLAQSPLVEVVQVYGIDPSLFAASD